MNCNHKKLVFGCEGCRKKIKFFNSDIELQLYCIHKACKKLQKVLEKDNISNKLANEISDTLDVIEMSCKEIYNSEI